MTRWQPTKKPTVTQQGTTKRTVALANCQRGKHPLTLTFRAGEQVCTCCGMVQYCPECLQVHHLPVSRAQRTYPRPCALHTKVEVQA